MLFAGCDHTPGDATNDNGGNTAQPPNDENADHTQGDNGNAGEGNGDTDNVSCEHSFGEWATTKQATCKEEGELTRICSKCSAEEKSTVSKTNVHTEVIDVEIASTCKEKGKTEGKHCSVCGLVIVAQASLPLANHTYDSELDETGNVCDFFRQYNAHRLSGVSSAGRLRIHAPCQSSRSVGRPMDRVFRQGRLEFRLVTIYRKYKKDAFYADKARLSDEGKIRKQKEVISLPNDK